MAARILWCLAVLWMAGCGGASRTAESPPLDPSRAQAESPPPAPSGGAARFATLTPTSTTVPGVSAAPPAPAVAMAPGVPSGTPSATAPAARAASPAAAEDAAPAAPAALGVLVPLSGPLAAYGRAYLDGVQLALAHPAAGRAPRVRVVPADTRGEPGGALLGARRLIHEERVAAILGSLQSAPTIVAGVEANCNGVPLLTNVAADDGLAAVGPYVFHTVPLRQAAARSSAELAVRSLRRTRAAIVHADEGDGRSLAQIFAATTRELGGTVVFSETYAPGITDFTPLAAQLAAATPDVIYLACGADDLLLIVPALQFLGVTAQLVGTEDLGSPRVLQAEGVDLEGALVPAPAAGNADGGPRFAALYGAGTDPTATRLAAAGFAAASEVIEAMAGTDGTADPEALQRALAARRPAARSSETPFLVVRARALEPFGAP